MEFLFWSVLERHESSTVIFGHTNSGKIRVGDTLTRVSRVQPDGSFIPSESVELRVLRIVAYRRDVDVLDTGMGAV